MYSRTPSVEGENEIIKRLQLQYAFMSTTDQNYNTTPFVPLKYLTRKKTVNFITFVFFRASENA